MNKNNKKKMELFKKFGVRKLISEAGLSYTQKSIYCDVNDLWRWINQNYISRDEIDNLLIELDKPDNLAIITIENIRQKIKKL